MLWDRGTWVPEVPDVDAALRKGELKFTLYGQKLRGSWVLVRTRFGRSGKPQWLLIKHRDQYASSEDIESEEPRSIASNRFMSDIARVDHGNVEKAAKADPARSRLVE
jgi:bifunctional non-homologous end joining protein LigD